MAHYQLFFRSKQQEIRLFFLGFFTLFFELLLIRFLSGNIWNLGYFPNLVLFGASIGMGSGFIFHRAYHLKLAEKLFPLASALILVLCLILFSFRLGLPGFGAGASKMGGDLYFTFNANNFVGFWEIFVLLIAFAFLVLFFFLVSQLTAKKFQLFSPLKAYALDITGSIAGILMFMGISYFQASAGTWFFLGAIVYLGCTLGTSAPLRIMGLLCLLATGALSNWRDATLIIGRAKEEMTSGVSKVRWSPYQKVEFTELPLQKNWIYVNGINHQIMLDWESLKSEFYSIPHRHRASQGLPPFKKALIIGAGSGNDVAMALASGAEYIDAVEIDPVLADLGKLHNANQPFQSQRVNLVIDDGRTFLNNTKTKYDLIIFALTDSLIKISPMSQLRLENYLFTVESFRKAYEKLNPKGELILYNFYREDWLIEKLAQMLRKATDGFPVITHKDGSFVIFSVKKIEEKAPFLEPTMELATDDWPFLYLKDLGIPAFYVKSMGLVTFLIFALLLSFELFSRRKSNLQTGSALISQKLAFLFMGIAFFLLETKGVIQFSLLFGTTWLNSSLVFLAVLTFVFLANLLSPKIKAEHTKVFFLLLIAACMIEAFFPLAKLLSIESPFLRFFLASVLTFSPVFFANIIFCLLFREQELADEVFGWNLMGANLGIVLEYFSMLLGYNSLALIVGCLYCFTFLFFLRFSKQRSRLESQRRSL